MAGSTALVSRKGAVRFTSSAARHSFAVRSGNRVVSALAALLTRISMRPNRSSVRRAISSGLPVAATSPGTANALSPSDSATSSARSMSRAFTATEAPRSYSRCAAARPNPRAAPVTIATRPSKSGRTNSRMPRGHVAPHAHPDEPEDEYADRDELRWGKVRHDAADAIVLGAQELHQEPLQARIHRPHAEQPPLGVLVFAQPPHDQEDQEAEKNLEQLRRIDRDHGERIGARREVHAELARHVSGRRGRRTFRELHGEPSARPGLAVVVTDRPAPRAADGITGGEPDAEHVGDVPEAQILTADHQGG